MHAILKKNNQTVYDVVATFIDGQVCIENITVQESTK